MKRVSSILTLIIACSSIFTSCVKDYLDTQTNFENLQAHLEMRTATDLGGGYNNIGGLANFAKANLVFTGTDPDTLYFYVNLASVNALNKDLNVTIGFDQDAFNNYSGITGDPIKYGVFPDSVFSLPVTSLTIPAGQHVAQASIIFYPDKAAAGLDPTKSYMLPIGILNGDGVSISANQGAVYYHSIGNPIAGTYGNSEWFRWNKTDTLGPPDYDVPYSTGFAPISPTKVAIQSYNGAVYDLSFTNTGGVLTNFILELDPASYGNFGLGELTGGPILEIADPINKIYRFKYAYNNTTPAPRVAIDEFKK